MENNNNTKLLLAFVAGAAVGAAVGYFLASDNKDEMLSNLKDTANKVKDEVSKTILKGKQMVDDFNNKPDDILGV